MSFKIGFPINPSVSLQIDTLQTLMRGRADSFINTSDETILGYMNLKAPWIKLSSGVFLEEDSDVSKFFDNKVGNQLAKENVLFNLDPNKLDPNIPAGNISELKVDQYGIRPKPGIIGMTMQSHNRFGSLRTAVVNFTCWSVEQMEIMELLYMRPGFSVLLEFGHSLFIDTPIRVEYNPNSDSFNEILLTYELNETGTGIDLFGDSKQKTVVEIYKAIEEKRRENKFAYDGVFGLVKNFNWSLRADGGYDCSTSIVSRGEIIESLRVDLSATIAESNIPIRVVPQSSVVNNSTKQKQVITGNTQQTAGNTASDIAFKNEVIQRYGSNFFDADYNTRTFNVKQGPYPTPFGATTPDLVAKHNDPFNTLFGTAKAANGNDLSTEVDLISTDIIYDQGASNVYYVIYKYKLK